MVQGLELDGKCPSDLHVDAIEGGQRVLGSFKLVDAPLVGNSLVVKTILGLKMERQQGSKIYNEKSISSFNFGFCLNLFYWMLLLVNVAFRLTVTASPVVMAPNMAVGGSTL